MSKSKKPKTLERLLADHTRFVSERDRHEKLGETLRIEEAGLVQRTDLDDPSQFRELSMCRLKRELCPTKVRQFGEAAEGVLIELTAACKAKATELQAVCEARLAQLENQFRAAISPLFDDAEIIARIVAEFTQYTPTGRRLYDWNHTAAATISVDFDPLRRAAELLEIEEALAGAPGSQNSENGLSE